jgi:hypothetical protein
MKQESKHSIAKKNSRKTCTPSRRETMKQESKHSIAKENSRKTCTPSQRETMKQESKHSIAKGNFISSLQKEVWKLKNTTTPLWKEPLK